MEISSCSLSREEKKFYTYHVQADDLTVGLLQLAELSKEVPEPGLSDNGVGRKDAHAVQLGRGVRLGGQVTPDNLVLSKTPCCESVSHDSWNCMRSAILLGRYSDVRWWLANTPAGDKGDVGLVVDKNLRSIPQRIFSC